SAAGVWWAHGSWRAPLNLQAGAGSSGARSRRPANATRASARNRRCEPAADTSCQRKGPARSPVHHPALALQRRDARTSVSPTPSVVRSRRCQQREHCARRSTAAGLGRGHRRQREVEDREGAAAYFFFRRFVFFAPFFAAAFAFLFFAMLPS